MLGIGLVRSLTTFPIILLSFVGAQSPPTIASAYDLSTSTALPFPTSTLAVNDTVDFISSSWSLNKNHVQTGANDLSFVDDPFPKSSPPNSNSSTGPVLRVTYPAQSYSNQTGGAQFYSQWNTSDGSTFQSMMLTYDLAFDSNFIWVKGGKLPGLRGGPDPLGCSGGHLSNGADCFSTRLMWRANGQGEVYAYVPTTDGICKASGILCDSEFGTSIDRGTFTFLSGQWTRVTLLVRLNTPGFENGFVGLFFNDVPVIARGGLQIRSSSDVSIGGLFFSTFFGGKDPSWATPVETHTYYRNFELWGSIAASNLTGPKVKSSGPRPQPAEWGWIICIAAIAFMCGLGLV